MTQRDASTTNFRRPATAGRFYPAEPVELALTVQRYFSEAKHADLSAPRAMIVPHAGYVCSGIVAAAGLRPLATLAPAPYLVYLMGPAHWVPVHGVGLSSADVFETPLGPVPVATDIVQELLEQDGSYRPADEAHVPEHCLEVELPFLQTLLPDVRIVPMLFDEEADPNRVANDLAARLEEDARSLVVVSSDLSHYLPYAKAQEADLALLDAIAEGELQTSSQGQACGILPILTLMAIAQRLKWMPHVVDYRNSGDTCSLRNEVVGYGAVVYTQ